MNEINLYEPRTMAKVVNRLPPVRTFLRDKFFRNVKTFNTKTVDVDFKKGKRALAPFVSEIIGGKVIANTGYSTNTYETTYISPVKITTVPDLTSRMPGETIYSGRSPAERAIEKLRDDFNELNDRVARREEWMSAQTLVTGKIPIIGEGVNKVIDFKFTNTETLAATKKWSQSGVDPTDDLKRWRTKVQITGFVNCDYCIMASDVVSAFVSNEIIQKKLDVKNYELGMINPRELPNGVTYIGYLPEINLSIYTYSEWFLDDWTDPDNPVNKPLIPDGKVLLLSSQAQYSRYYGAITLIPEGQTNFITVEGTLVPHSWVEHLPDRRFLQLMSKPLTVPHEVDSWFVATVL